MVGSRWIQRLAVTVKRTVVRFHAMAAGLRVRHSARENALRRGKPGRHVGHTRQDVRGYRELSEKIRIVAIAWVAPPVTEKIQLGAGERPATGLVDPGLNGEVVEVMFLWLVWRYLVLLQGEGRSLGFAQYVATDIAGDEGVGASV